MKTLETSTVVVKACPPVAKGWEDHAGARLILHPKDCVRARRFLCT